MQIRVLVAEHVWMGLHNAAEGDPVRDRVHLRNREPLGYALRSALTGQAMHSNTNRKATMAGPVGRSSFTDAHSPATVATGAEPTPRA